MRLSADDLNWECVAPEDVVNPDLQSLMDRLADLEALAPRYVFVTAGTYDGNLMTAGAGADGFEGGDNLCQDAADATTVTPAGIYKAWLSKVTGGLVDAKDRVDLISGNYLLNAQVGAEPNGNILALNSADLLDRTVRVNPWINESGASIGPAEVWTGTDGDGTSDSEPDCAGWTSNLESAKGVVGITDNAAVNGWTKSGESDCDIPRHLYCFQVLGGG